MYVPSGSLHRQLEVMTGMAVKDRFYCYGIEWVITILSLQQRPYSIRQTLQSMGIQLPLYYFGPYQKMIKHCRNFFAFCKEKALKRQYLEPELISFGTVDGYHHISTKSYSFLKSTQTKQQQLMAHKSNSPASLLLKNYLHLFQEGMPEANMAQNYKAFLKLLRERYKKSFGEGRTGYEIYHLERRMKSDMRRYQNRIGVLEGRHKHYPIWIPYREHMGRITLQNYQKKGVYIDILKQTVYQKGKVWMPTRQRYLNLLQSYLKSNAHQLNLIKTIADLGVGSGVLSFILANRIKKHQKIVGIDMNPDAVQTANINAVKLKIDNFHAYQSDLRKDEEAYAFLVKKQNLPKQYDMIVSNPPWIVAKKLSSEAYGLQDGVYDEKEEFLQGILRFAKNHLKKTGKLLLFYSTLSKQIGLTKNTIESLCLSNKLNVASKLQVPYLEKIEPDDNLQMFKQKSKIVLYEIVHS